MVTIVSKKFICFFLEVMTVYGAFPCSIDSSGFDHFEGLL